MVFPGLVDAFGNCRPITMNIVHIVFEFPLPHGSGGDLRNRAVDAGLSHAGATSLISVQAYFRTGKQKLRRKPSYIEADLPRGIIDAVVDEVAKKAPDLVIIDGVFLADIAHRLLSNGYRVIVNMHNIESSLLKETDQARDGWLSGLLHQKRWKPAIIADRLLAAAAERVWVCSADDAFSLESLVGRVARIDIIPNPLPPWCVDAASMPLSGVVMS